MQTGFQDFFFQFAVIVTALSGIVKVVCALPAFAKVILSEEVQPAKR
ncbi:MAG: hypothetical protein UCN50_04145 [Anaerotignum sp.]|nr:hypothetical protein [Anaerotignum sp.]MEE0701145.1 hypothetical protein [Anaerotignum sp.]